MSAKEENDKEKEKDGCGSSPNITACPCSVCEGVSAWSEFQSRPAGFQFLSQDVFEISPVVKHNLPFLPFAEGALVEIKAKASCCPSPSSLPSSRDSDSDMPVCCAVYQESNVSRYIQQVQRDRPALLLLLAERKGSRRAANTGLLGPDWDADVNRGCRLEQEVRYLTLTRDGGWGMKDGGWSGESSSPLLPSRLSLCLDRRL